MRSPLGRRFASAAVSFLLVTGCGDVSPTPDAGRATDAALGDAGFADAGRGPDDGGPRSDAGSTGALTGRVTYDRLPLTSAGLGSTVADPLEGASVVALDGASVVGTAVTDADGRFRIEVVAAGPLDVRVVAQGALDAPTEVADHDGAIYAVRAGPFRPSTDAADVHISEANNAGAFAIFDTMRGGLVFAADAFARDVAFPAQQNLWERGRSTPLGTSYLDGDVVWLLGGPQDTDEYDVPVILHELGHFLQYVYDATDTHLGVGDPHAGADTDPRLAWSEGWATHFANLVLGHGEYYDTIGGEIALAYDVERLPLSDEFVGQPSGNLDQNLSEWLVAASLFRVYRQGEPAVQAARSMQVVGDWFGPAVTDRGRTGADFVDFLDGYLCLHDGLHRDVIESHVVGDRSFPYDFGGTCPLKPGRPPLARSDDAGAREPPAGRRVRGARGRWLREVVLAPPLSRE